MSSGFATGTDKGKEAEKKQKDFAFVVVIHGGVGSMEVSQRRLDW